MFRTAAILLLSSTAVLAQYSTPMRDVDNPARQPWSCDVLNYMPNVTDRNSFSCPAVPAGKRLVIEFVSIRIQLPAGINIEAVAIVARSNGVSHLHYVPVIPIPANSNRYTVSQMVLIYADAATTVTGLAEGGVSSDLVLLGSLSGYLVNMP
jgi:hypothetical protein